MGFFPEMENLLIRFSDLFFFCRVSGTPASDTSRQTRPCAGRRWPTSHTKHFTGYDHTWLKTPYPVRFVKLSSHRLSLHCKGGENFETPAMWQIRKPRDRQPCDQRLSTYAIKDTVSVLYWYEKLSRNGNFLKRFSNLLLSFFSPCLHRSHERGPDIVSSGESRVI